MLQRNQGPLPVFDVCRTFAADGEVVKPIPRARGRAPHTMYYLVNESRDTQRKVFTAFWSNDGETVELLAADLKGDDDL